MPAGKPRQPAACCGGPPQHPRPVSRGGRSPVNLQVIQSFSLRTHSRTIRMDSPCCGNPRCWPLHRPDQSENAARRQRKTTQPGRAIHAIRASSAGQTARPHPIPMACEVRISVQQARQHGEREPATSLLPAGAAFSVCGTPHDFLPRGISARFLAIRVAHQSGTSRYVTVNFSNERQVQGVSFST